MIFAILIKYVFNVFYILIHWKIYWLIGKYFSWLENILIRKTELFMKSINLVEIVGRQLNLQVELTNGCMEHNLSYNMTWDGGSCTCSEWPSWHLIVIVCWKSSSKTQLFLRLLLRPQLHVAQMVLISVFQSRSYWCSCFLE